jgi:hypothetical protein
MWRGWCDDDRALGAACLPGLTVCQSEGDREIVTEDLPAPILTGLDPGIIPQRAFPLRRWFYANPLWYYHTPATRHRLHTDAQFYELLDPDLRELCQALLGAGLYTTPSCQGHFYPRQRFERVWDELSREADSIRESGLVVHDSETDCPYQFQAPQYQLPWPDFAAFLEQAFPHQNHGYIGIAVPLDRTRLLNRLKADAYQSPPARIEPDGELSAALGQPIFSVHGDAEAPEERDAAWKAVTHYVRAVLAAAA